MRVQDVRMRCESLGDHKSGFGDIEGDPHDDALQFAVSADAPSPRYMREQANWSSRVLRSEYLWAWHAGKRLA